MEKVDYLVKIGFLYDEEEKLYTFFDGRNKGGAIICHSDFDKGIETFKEAMNVGICVKNMLEFNRKTNKWYELKYYN